MKSIIRVLLKSALIAAATLSSAAAMAQTSGFYGGGAVGQAISQDACSGVTVGCEDSSVGWKIFGGYQFNENIGAELGYVEFGKSTYATTSAGIPVTGSQKPKAFELVGVGTLPLGNNVSVYGKLGVAMWEVDVSAPAAAGVAANTDGTDLTYGLGLKYDFTKNIGARLEWQRYDNAGKSANTGESDIDLFSVGVVFKF